jgi:lysozyme
MLTPEQNCKLLAEELARDEGQRLTVYDDATGYAVRPGVTVEGHLTIGVGRALDVRGISPAEAAFLLDNDIAAFTLGLQQALPWFSGLDPVRQRALTNMAFNLGVHGLLGFRDAMAFMANRQYDAAACAIEDSAWYKEVGARAARIAGMIRTGTA